METNDALVLSKGCMAVSPVTTADTSTAVNKFEHAPRSSVVQLEQLIGDPLGAGQLHTGKRRLVTGSREKHGSRHVPSFASPSGSQPANLS